MLGNISQYSKYWRDILWTAE